MRSRGTRFSSSLDDMGAKSTVASWGLVACSVVALAGYGLIGPAATGRLYDDAFYYFQIARHVSDGKGPTFDGLHMTNGFHPLWLALLIPIFGAVAAPEDALVAVAVLQIALTAGALLVLFRTLAPRTGLVRAAAAAAIILATPGATIMLLGGMETSLFFLVIVLVWRCWLAFEDAPHADRLALRLGVIAAVASLVRLEAVILAPLLGLLAWRRCRVSCGTLVAIAGPAILTVATAALISRITFGLWLPVSGLVKANLVRSWTTEWTIRSLLELPWAGEIVLRRFTGLAPTDGRHIAVHYGLLALVALICWRYQAWLRPRLAHPRIGVLMVMCGALVAILKVSILDLWAWERLPLVLVPAVCMAAILPAGKKAVAALVLITLWAMTGGARWAVRARDHNPEAHFKQAAEWLRAHTTPDDRIGSWNAGRLAFYSDRAVVNLDGLANDAHYFHTAVLGGRLGEYLTTERIDWLADCGKQDAQSIPYTPGSPHRLNFQRVVTFPGNTTLCPDVSVWRSHP
jgi:hypothetical protein